MAAAKNKQMRLNLADSVLQKRLYRRKEQTAAFDIPRSGLLGQIFFSAVSAVLSLITAVSSWEILISAYLNPRAAPDEDLDVQGNFFLPASSVPFFFQKLATGNFRLIGPADLFAYI